MFEPLLDALPAVLQWQNLVAIVLGTVAGMVIGSLPGLTATMGIAILIPLTFAMDPLVALGMMAGIYNGAMYGGAIPAILLKIPGTPPSIVTTFDGAPMAKQGRAAFALKIACWSSAVGGMISAISLMLFAPPLVRVTLLFGPAEYFWVAVFGLSSIAVLLGRDPVKGLAAACIGLLFSMVGIDTVSGHERFTFGSKELLDGLDLIVVLTGLYALPPAIRMAEEAAKKGVKASDLKLKAGDSMKTHLRDFIPVWIRCSVIGVFVGILPGTGGSMAAFIGYNETRRVDPDPDSYGKGNPKGVAAAECGNNADNAAAMIPALTLGVPGSGVAAVILAGLLVHGLQPGPQLFRENPDVVYGFMIQMFLTSVLLFCFGGEIAFRIFAQVLRLPRVLLAPMIFCLAVVGVYTLENSVSGVWIMLIFGLIGYVLTRCGFPLAPIILGLILGDLAEQQLRITLLISQGDVSALFQNGISQLIIGLTCLVLSWPLFQRWRKRRKEAQAEAA